MVGFDGLVSNLACRVPRVQANGKHDRNVPGGCGAHQVDIADIFDHMSGWWVNIMNSRQSGCLTLIKVCVT